MREPDSNDPSAAMNSRRTRRVRRWLRGIVIGLSATVLAVVVAVLVVLHTDWGREQVRREALAALSEVFPGGIEVRHVEGSVLRTLTVHDVVIHDQKGRRAITIKRVSVNVGLVALLRHTIQLKRLEVERASVLAIDDGDGFNLATLKKPSDSPLTWRVDLNDVRLTGGSIALTRPSTAVPGGFSTDHFDDMALRGTATIDPQGSIVSSIGASLRWRERGFTAELRADGRMSDGIVEIKRAEARMAGLSAVIRELRFVSPSDVAGIVELAAAEGSLRQLVPGLPASPVATLTARVKPQSADLLRLTLNASIGEATLSGEVAVVPLLARARATGELQLRNVRPAAMLGAHLKPELAHTQLTSASIAFDAAASLVAFSLDSIAGSVRTSAELSYGPKTRVPLTLDARLDKRRLTATANGSTGSSRLRATADVTIGDRQLLQVHKARIEGHLAAKDVPAKLRASNSLAGVIDMDLSAKGNVDLGALTSSTMPAASLPAPARAAATTSTTRPRLPKLTVTGFVDGAGLRFSGYAADSLHLALPPVVIATWPRGNLVAKLAGVRADGQRMPNLELRADSASAGVVDVDIRLTPPPAPATDDRTVAQAAAAGSSTGDANVSRRNSPGRDISSLAQYYEGGTLDLDASIRLDRDYRGADITLRNFRGALRGLEVVAKGGFVALRPKRQEVRGLRLRSNAGSIAIDGVRAGRNVTARIAVDQLELAPLAAVAPQLAGLKGRVQLRASGSLRRGKLEGELRGEIAHLVARPGAAPVDVDLMTRAAPDLLHLEARARNARIGEILVDADVAPPADVFNRAAWQALDRRSVHHLRVHSPSVDLGALRDGLGLRDVRAGPPTTTAATTEANTAPLAAVDGRASIDLEVAPTGGSLHAAVADLTVPGSPLAMDVTVGGEFNADGNADLRATARMAAVAVHATAALHIPTHPFAPSAWTLTPERLSRVTLEVPRFAVTDSLAATLGLGTWRGQVSASFEFDLGLNHARGRVAIIDVRGGPLRRPIELVADLTADDGTMRVVGEGKLDGSQAMRLGVELPWPSISAGSKGRVAIRSRWADLPLKGAITFGPLPAATIAHALGASSATNSQPATTTTPAAAKAAPKVTALTTDDRTKATALSTDDRTKATAAQTRGRLLGTLGGKLALAGTVGAPDVTLDVRIADLGTRRAKIRELRLIGKYTTGAIHAELTGSSDDSSRLHGRFDVQLDKPANARATLSASGFDLSPLSRLAPAALLGVKAQLDGALEVRGLDPKRMQIAGNLTISKIRLPIANQVGALTDATLRLTMAPGRATVGLQGDIETAKVTATASAALDGILPRSATLDLALSDLALIVPKTPTVGGKLHVDARLAAGRWKLDARLSDGLIRIPSEQGSVLHPVSPPADVVFVSNARDVEVPPKRLAQTALRWASSPVSSPWLEVALAIESVTLRTEEATGVVRGKIDVDIADSGMSTAGVIRLTGGDVMLFGRRYQIARAALTFDGPLDPSVDAELRHDFSQLTLTATVTGRVSKPQFHFRSSPPDYTEAQLLGFFLGGNPAASGRDGAATSVAAAVASQTLGSMITRQLPVRVDVLTYQPATTSSSGALVTGRWITEKLLLLMRNRTSPRPLENGTEGELQYWLSRGLLLDGVAGDRGTFGLDLLWNRRW